MRRAIIFMSLALCAALAGPTGPAAAQEILFLIRHAEKDAGEDPPLTDAGRARAGNWAEMLRPAGIDVVVSTEARRTRETAGIVAAALGLPHREVPMADIAGLIDLLGFDHAGDRVLVVGHRETIPRILGNLGAAEAVEIGPEDFGSLILFRPEAEAGSGMLRLAMP